MKAGGRARDGTDPERLCFVASRTNISAAISINHSHGTSSPPRHTLECA
jgi:hypothetical protein